VSRSYSLTTTAILSRSCLANQIGGPTERRHRLATIFWSNTTTLCVAQKSLEPVSQPVGPCDRVSLEGALACLVRSTFRYDSWASANRTTHGPKSRENCWKKCVTWI